MHQYPKLVFEQFSPHNNPTEICIMGAFPGFCASQLKETASQISSVERNIGIFLVLLNLPNGTLTARNFFVGFVQSQILGSDIFLNERFAFGRRKLNLSLKIVPKDRNWLIGA